MDIRIIRQIGVGITGTVYLAEANSEKCICKIEKGSAKSITYRKQVIFDEFARQHPDKFMTLIGHGVISDCDHEQPIPNWAKGAYKKELQDKNKQRECFYMLYRPVYTDQLQKIHKQVISIPYVWRRMLYQLFEQLQLMSAAGFTHNDLHPRNIMYTHHDVYNFHIIDYGSVMRDDWLRGDPHATRATNLAYLLWDIAIVDPVVQWMVKHNMPLPFDISAVGARLKKKPAIWSTAAKYVPRRVPTAIRNDVIVFVIMLTDFGAIREALGPAFAGMKDTMKLAADQTELLLYIVKHMADANYSAILRQIKKEGI